MAQEESAGCTLCCDWSAKSTGLRDTIVAQCHWKRVVLHIDRQGGIKSYSAHHKLTRLSVHSLRRVVGREKGHQ